MDLTLRPARHAFAVTPSDSADLTPRFATKGLFVGGAGNLNIDTMDGKTVLMTGIPAGAFVPVQVKRVRSTSTTATNIVALA